VTANVKWRSGPGERMSEQPGTDDPADTAPEAGAVVVTRHRDHHLPAAAGGSPSGSSTPSWPRSSWRPAGPG